MKSNITKGISLSIVLSVMLFLSGCARDIQNDQRQKAVSEGANNLNEAEDKQKLSGINEEITSIAAKFQTTAAILTRDEVLKDTYFILQETQVEKTPDSVYSIYYDKNGYPYLIFRVDGDTYYFVYHDIYGNSFYLDDFGDFTVPVVKNDMILVIGEDDDYYRVTFAHGDVPRIHGYISKNAISFDEGLFVNANQGRIIDAMTYNSIEGRELGLQSGTGMVQRRENGWIELAFPGGADNTFWIRGESLRFDLAHDVLDKVTE